jgi:hypothetical protein
MFKPEIEIRDGTYGKRAMVIGPWQPAFTNVALKEQIVEIAYMAIPLAKGTDDLAFLNNFDDLLALSITTPSEMAFSNHEIVYKFKELRELVYAVKITQDFDLLKFPQLESLSIKWTPGKTDSVFACTKLRLLDLSRYSEENLERMKDLSNLKTLVLSRGRLRTLKGIEHISQLERLLITSCSQLEDLTDICCLESLKDLAISGCKNIVDVSPIENLKNLTTLILENLGEIASIRPLANLFGLERFGFAGSTNIRDGDLAILVGLPNLKTAAFRNRKHYSHTREETASIIESRTETVPRNTSQFGNLKNQKWVQMINSRRQK